MSNQIQCRRGTDAERVGTIFANGEPVWCTDTLELWVGDGVTPGGRSVKGLNAAYVRDFHSTRFNEHINVGTVAEALDVIFNFVNNVANNLYYGDVTSNAPIQDETNFFAGLTSTQWSVDAKDIVYYSNVTYRVLAYPKSYGPLADIQDPNFNYTTIRNSYEDLPREVTYNGTVFYVYFSVEAALSPNGKTIRYII
jgi:hypothetical protein